MKGIHIYLSLFLQVILIVSARGQHNQLSRLLDEAYKARLQADYETNAHLLKAAENLKDLQKQPLLRAKLYAELSKQCLVSAAYDKAKHYADTALALAAEVRLPLVSAYAYVTLASYYNYLDVGDLAVENVQKALDILKTERDPALSARAYYILYGVYSGWNDLESSDKYARLAINRALRAPDHELLANAYSAYSVVHEFRYRDTGERRHLDSMQHYLHRSMDVYNRHPGKVSKRSYAIANVNMANYFFRYGEPAQAVTQDSIVHYAETARKIYQPFDRNYGIMGSVNGLLSEVARLRGDTGLAEHYLLDSYSQLTGSFAPSYYTLSNVAQGLSDIYNNRGDYKKALFYQKKKEEFDQKIFDQTEMVNAKKLEAQYENKRLIADVRAAEQKSQSRRIQSLLLGGVCFLLLACLFLLRASFKSKQKMHAEEQARLRTEQQLLQMQKEQMQKEAMADALQIERKNRLLVQLKDKLKAVENTGDVDKMIKEEMRLEETVEQSARAFKNINPDFFQRLGERSGNRLSALEMKHCAYIHMGLDTKIIAAAFHITPKSVRVSKYRIKQKLGLDKETDLDRFLQNLV